MKKNTNVLKKTANEFLSQKFIPPALPDKCAPRRELLSLLHETAARHFVFISAPAASGKTVSSLLWLASCKRRSVFIGLDEYDNSPAVFYKQLAIGFFSLQPDNTAMHNALTDPEFSTRPVEQTIRLISEMRPEQSPCAIIIDDAHFITDEAILKSLPAVLERLPGTFVTMILSESPMPDSLLRVINEDCIITQEELRFSPDEIRLYFQDLGWSLTAEESQFAFLATGGLATAISTVASSCDFEREKSAVAFVSYFESNIWNTWDEKTRDFCLKTSVADEFSPSLAAVLSGYEDSSDIIQGLLNSNSFLHRIDGDTYSYHHLFEDFLKNMAPRCGIEQSGLYKKAAGFYRENGDYSTALRYWLGSCDYEGMAQFLLLFMFQKNRSDVAEYLSFWRSHFMRDFPREAFLDFPALHVCCAWYYYMMGRFREFETHMDESYANMEKIASYDSKFVEFTMLMCCVDPRLKSADKLQRLGMLQRLIKDVSQGGIILYTASFTHNLPYAHRSSFDFSDALCAAENIARIRDSAFATLLGDQIESILLLGAAGVSYERNDLMLSLKQLKSLEKLMTEQNSIELQVSAKFLYHSVLLKLGREEEASEALTALEGFVRKRAPHFSANLDAYKVRQRLLDGDRQAARAWLDRLDKHDAPDENGNHGGLISDGVELLALFQHFTSVRAYMVLADEETARRYLTVLCRFGQDFNRVCDICEATILQSAISWAADKKSEAAAMMEEALLRLQDYGYTRLVIDEGAAVLPILKRIARKAAKKEYQGRLRYEFVNECAIAAYAFSKRHKGVCVNLARQKKPVKLSRQQTQVLTLLSKGYSNAMIVDETKLKISTVKTHTSLAYQKLGVNNAMDAVLRAKELELL